MDIVTTLKRVQRTVAGFSLATLVASFLAIGVAQAATFSDVNPSDWFYNYVEDLVALGVVNGDMPSYRPADNVNRAEMAKLVVEAFDLTLETPDTATFTDVAKDAWYYSYVETAAKNGVVGGYKDTEGTLTGYYGPADSVTREQAAKMIVLGAPLTSNTSCGPSFSDVGVTSWSYDYVETLYAWSVVDGYADGSFGATTNINRAEIAKIVSNGMNPMLRPCGGFNLESASALSATTVEACFSQDYDETSAMMVENYAIEDLDGVALEVTDVEASSDPMCVVLTTADQTEGTNYDLTVSDVTGMDAMALGENMASFSGYTLMATGGDLTVEISEDTPSGVTLPGAVSGVELMKFVVGAASDDVVITSFEIHRGGTGLDTALTNIAIFDENSRVSKAKSFNSSTDNATVNLLSGGVTINANKTKTFTVIGSIGDAATNNGSEFFLEIVNADAVTSNAGATEGTFPVTADTFKVGSTDGGTVTWLDDGKPSDPKLGALQADVSKFRLRNESGDNALEVSGLTLYSTGTVKADTEMENYALYIDGDFVAETATAYNKYITFKLGEPFSIGTSKTVNVVVKADVVGGAGNTIAFKLDNTLDLQATDTKFGYGAKVDYTTGSGTGTAYEAETLTVQAGEVAIVATDASSTDVLKNKKNVVAGSFKVTVKEGLNLEIQKARITLTNEETTASANATAGGCSIASTVYDSALSCLVDNVELYDKKTGSVYDLSATLAATDKTGSYEDTNLTIPMTSGETREFEIRFDTLNRVIDTSKLVFAIQNIGNTAGGLYMVETNDDTAVTDITPSSITYKTLNGVAATATVDAITLSSTKSAVIGDTGVNVLEFVVGAGNASPLKLSEVKVEGGYVDGIQSVTTATVATAAVTTDLLNFDNGDCIVTFTNGGAEDLNCSDNVGVIDSAVDTTATLQATKLAQLTNLTNYTMSAGTVATTFVMTHKGTPVAGNVVFATGAPAANTIADGAADTVDVTVANTTVGVVNTNPGTGANASNTTVTALKLYRVDGLTETLLKEKSGSTLAAGVATFDGLNETIALNESTKYRVKIDLVNDNSKAEDTLRFKLNSLNLDDQDSDDVTTGTVNGTAGQSLTAMVVTMLSNRTVTIKGVGTLTVTADNTNTETSRDKNVIGNATSDYVASYEFVAVNEPIVVKDLKFVDGTGNLANAVSELILYGDDKTTEIARKSVTSATTTFTNLNYEVAEGSQNIYVKVVTRKIGKDEVTSLYAAMTLTAEVTKADGLNSGKSLTAAATAVSKTFSTVATEITNVSFVSTATVGGTTVTVPASLTVGENVFAIVAVATGPSTNTRIDNGAAVKTALKQLVFTVNTDIDNTGDAVALNSLTVDRVGGSGDATFATTHAAFSAGNNTITTTVASADAANGVIANDSIAYYAIKGSVTGIDSTNNKYVQAKFLNLNNGSEIVYNTDEVLVPLANVTALRLTSATVDAPKVASNY